MKRHVLLSAAALLLFTAPTFAQDPNADAGKAAVQQMSQVTKAQDFVMMAAMSDMFEIQTGLMAQKQSANQNVQQFGARLVKDHSTSTEQLTAIANASQLQSAIPAQLDERHQAIVDGLSHAKAEGFDAAFLQAQVQAHKEGIALFESYSQNGDNEQLKAFAAKGLPVLKEHLAMAEKLSGSAATTQ